MHNCRRFSIIKNNKLNKFLTKGLTYRVPQAINVPKAMIEISSTLYTCIEAMKPKTKYATWKILSEVKENIREIKQKIKPKQSKPVLSDPDVKKCLEELHRKFVIVTIDRSSNSFRFICRKYYISTLLAKFLQIKIKIQHQHIHKHKILTRNYWN